jgi:hypothetical protein
MAEHHDEHNFPAISPALPKKSLSTAGESSVKTSKKRCKSVCSNQMQLATKTYKKIQKTANSAELLELAGCLMLPVGIEPTTY